MHSAGTNNPDRQEMKGNKQDRDSRDNLPEEESDWGWDEAEKEIMGSSEIIKEKSSSVDFPRASRSRKKSTAQAHSVSATQPHSQLSDPSFNSEKLYKQGHQLILGSFLQGNSVILQQEVNTANCQPIITLPLPSNLCQLPLIKHKQWLTAMFQTVTCCLQCTELQRFFYCREEFVFSFFLSFFFVINWKQT